jgi:hypothetical protein
MVPISVVAHAESELKLTHLSNPSHSDWIHNWTSETTQTRALQSTGVLLIGKARIHPWLWWFCPYAWCYLHATTLRQPACCSHGSTISDIKMESCWYLFCPLNWNWLEYGILVCYSSCLSRNRNKWLFSWQWTLHFSFRLHRDLWKASATIYQKKSPALHSGAINSWQRWSECLHSPHQDRTTQVPISEE